MSVTVSPKATISPDVDEFLRNNGAQVAFQTICELIRECFPEVLSVQTDLIEDHDEPGWQRVRIWFTLPAASDLEHVLEQQRLFLERFMSLFLKAPLSPWGRGVGGEGFWFSRPCPLTPTPLPQGERGFRYRLS